MLAHPMMKCGCVAQGTCSSSGGVTFDPPIPSCVIHSCLEVAEDAPELAGRTAQCTYLPKGHAPKPSSLDLAFFKYKGPGSPESKDLCKCGYAWIAHQPRWDAVIKVSRRWHQRGDIEETLTKCFHAPDDLKQRRAEVEADFFRSQTRDVNTKVHSAEVVEIRPLKNPLKCREFVARGAYEFDEYYCGCHGWD